MSRYKDNSPIPHTCPRIDEVISAIESVEWTEDNYWTKESATAIMEEIRNANHQLRQWGNEMANDANDKQELIDDLEAEIKQLKSQIQDHEKHIKNLENELEQATS